MDRKLLFESNQTTNKGQHLLRQQTERMVVSLDDKIFCWKWKTDHHL
jgi:hypothetical protein